MMPSPLSPLSSSMLTTPPQSVLFCCTMNSVRSPMCEGLFKKIFGTQTYVDSAGIHHGMKDAFMLEVMQEQGINMQQHYPKSFDDLFDQSFDVVITLSPEAQHHAIEFTRTHSCELLFWHTLDPTIIEGTRDNKLEGYRQVLQQLQQKILDTFTPLLTPVI